MYEIEILIIMPLLARMCGGGFGGDKLPSMAPEILFAIPFGIAVGSVFGITFGLIALACSALAMRTGHGVVLHWGDKGFFDEYPEIMDEVKTRRQRLSPVVDFIADRLEITKKDVDGLHTLAYCRLFMAVKGFLVGLPVGGIHMAILFPLSYEIGSRLGRPKISEMISGFFAALSIIIFLVAMGGVNG